LAMFSQEIKAARFAESSVGQVFWWNLGFIDNLYWSWCQETD
jgi:hypothetical protein